CEQEEVDWLLAPFESEDRRLFQTLQKTPQGVEHGKAAFHSFDCSIMDIADDIAYGVHDLEDAIHLRLILREKLDRSYLRELLRETYLFSNENTLLDALFSEDIAMRKQAIGEMVNYFITKTYLKVIQADFSEP